MGAWLQRWVAKLALTAHKVVVGTARAQGPDLDPLDRLAVAAPALPAGPRSRPRIAGDIGRSNCPEMGQDGVTSREVDVARFLTDVARY